MRLDVLATGYASLDHLFRVTRSPMVDETAIIENLAQVEYGGCGLNVTVALNKLGFATGVAAVLGEDKAGKNYYNYLQQVGVDVRDVLRLPNSITSCSYIFSNPKGGYQIYFFPGAAMDWQGPLELINLSQTRYTLVTVGAPHYNRAFVEASLASGVPLIWQLKADTQAYPPEQLGKLLEASQILFMNRIEMQYLLSCAQVNSIEGLLRKKDQIAVVTMGSQGSQVYSWQGCAAIPVVPAKAFVDPTGAGDGYTSGFLAGWLKGFSPETCGRLGATLASFVVEKYGCQTNLPDWTKLKSRFKQFFMQSLSPE